jgi:glutathionyl-hydroquinone reductase
VEIKHTDYNYQIASEWGQIRHGIPQRSTLDPLLFLLYINDLPSFIRNKSKPILFADDTSVIVTNSSPADFVSDIMTVFEQLNKWFSANNLSNPCNTIYNKKWILY